MLMKHYNVDGIVLTILQYYNITDLDDSGLIFCICHSPYVDSEEGLCTIVGKSQRTATAIRSNEILLFEKIEIIAASFLACSAATGST